MPVIQIYCKANRFKKKATATELLDVLPSRGSALLTLLSWNQIIKDLSKWNLIFSLEKLVENIFKWESLWKFALLFFISSWFTAYLVNLVNFLIFFCHTFSLPSGDAMKKSFLCYFNLIFFLFFFWEALRCYSCSITSHSSDTMCLSDPVNVVGQSVVNCNRKYCTILRQELKVGLCEHKTFWPRFGE